MKRRTWRRPRGERGAVALLVAALATCLLLAGALTVDITMQTDRQQNLVVTLDSAAQAGAFRMPDTAAATVDALRFATLHDDSATGANTPFIDFWCVVASSGTAPSFTPDTNQIPATCEPGVAPYTVAKYPGTVCNSTRCAIPCPATKTCNTVRMSSKRDVPFSLARVVGITKGSTGALQSVACKGSCGTVSPNPMDVAVVADRTGSMSSTDINAMVSGIKSMFQVMTPSQQYVSLGSIGRSATLTRSTAACNSTTKGLTYPSSSALLGQWVPVGFHNDYLTGTALNSASNLVKATNCLTTSSGTGTHLAAPMKAAARYLLNYDLNNISSLPARTGTPRKAIIFETDGQPNESITGGSTSLGSATDIGAGSDGNLACANMKTVAQNAKDANILIVTVAYNLSTDKCGSGISSPTVAAALAAAASPKAPGVPSTYDYDCSTSAGRIGENADGDYFFCGASGDDLASLFKTAFGQLSGGIRLMRMPS